MREKCARELRSVAGVRGLIPPLYDFEQSSAAHAQRRELHRRFRLEFLFRQNWVPCPHPKRVRVYRTAGRTRQRCELFGSARSPAHETPLPAGFRRVRDTAALVSEGELTGAGVGGLNTGLLDVS